MTPRLIGFANPQGRQAAVRLGASGTQLKRLADRPAAARASPFYRASDATTPTLSGHARAGGPRARTEARCHAACISFGESSAATRFPMVDAEPRSEEAGPISTLLLKAKWLSLAQDRSGRAPLVRLSPYDSNARHHTSFASVWVYPVFTTISRSTSKRATSRNRHPTRPGAGGQHATPRSRIAFNAHSAQYRVPPAGNLADQDRARLRSEVHGWYEP